MSAKTKWGKLDYQRIKSVGFKNSSLTVGFENDDIVTLDINVLLPQGVLNDASSQIEYNDFEINIPTDAGVIEVPWDKIRILTDREYSKYIGEQAEEQAKLVGVRIKELREKNGIKAIELAERAGVTPQTISRIEKGRTDVGFTTLKRLLAAMGYGLKDLANTESDKKTEKNWTNLIKRLSKSGVDTRLLLNRLIPRRMQAILENNSLNNPELTLDQAVSYITEVFGWKSHEIWGSQNLQIHDRPYKLAYFKTPQRANLNQVKAYSHYAYYLAKLVIKTAQTEVVKYPEDTDQFRTEFHKYGSLTFSNLLDYVWDLGISVLPLNDSGVFHGASWNIDGQHVIILKQNNRVHSRWVFDLLHELYHVFVHLNVENSSVIETEELSPFSNLESEEESEANTFANQVIFGTQAEKIAEKCIDIANGRIENLKKATQIVSKQSGVRSDFISNYLAFRLSAQGHNWWGTASTFQITDPDPFVVATEKLRSKLSLNELNSVEQNLLNMALTI